MKLQKSQIAQVRQYLLANGLETPAVLDDLQDHLCCMIEEKITGEVDFETAFSQTRGFFLPEDVQEIQRDTIYFLTIKSRIMLVKGIFITAFLSVFCFALGSAMYNLLLVAFMGEDDFSLLVQHMMRTLGMFIFCFGFLPLLFRFGYREFVARLQQ